MIEISPVTALMLYLCLTLATLFGIWVYHHFRWRKKKIVILEKKLFICEYCNNAYLDGIGNSLTKCTQCGSFNKKI
jgi:ribosomal protein L37AE/L43A